MVIGVVALAPLEFTDCLLDTPEFRDNLNRHEKELERTSQQIKRIIKEVKDLLSAAKSKWLVLLLAETAHQYNIQQERAKRYLATTVEASVGGLNQTKTASSVCL